MNSLSFKELQSKYEEALELINDLSETLEKREWDIILLKENISELEEILYSNGIFRHYDFD
ncbi:MAG: hypothetical protein K6G12_05730 [Lachnospiraceae bacterium]|nr:hypothetical protein [Lachnospiraceae bacterium]